MASSKAGQARGVLDHPGRTRIYRHMLMLPGDHFRSIVRALNLPLGTVRHHISVLVMAGLVYTIRQGARTRHYAIGTASHPEVNRLYEKHWRFRDIRTRVLLAVRWMRDPGPSAVGRVLGVSRQLALYHMNYLETIGALRRVGGRWIPVASFPRIDASR